MLTRKKEISIFVAIFVLFLLLRLPAIHAPYHQDEYKWPIIVNPALTEPGGIPHPPVGEFIYTQAGFLVGYDNFRVVPLVFSILNLFLLFYLVRMVWNSKTALWAAFLFSICLYSVLASLMVDTDGAIMVFFFLLSAIGYYKLRLNNFDIKNNFKNNWFWIALLVVGALGGFLTKVSFAVALAAFALDFAFEKNILNDKKKVLKYSGSVLVIVAALTLALYAVKLIFPFFNLQSSLKYWEHFANFTHRGWLQTFIQFIKAILYSSPLLLLPLIFTGKELWIKARPFFLFIIIGLFFYLFAFDFSTGALDRYLQFLIVPLSIITSLVLSRLEIKDFKKKTILLPIIISLIIFAIQFFKHFTPPLYPKTEWLHRVLSLHWNFLFPFTGGSGPLPFYVSFLFMALVWIASIILALSALKNKTLQSEVLIGLLIFGIAYNAVFTEEYVFGKINGSSTVLVKDAAAFIKDHAEIKKVVVYNDNGGYEIQKIGKYEKRLYIDPQFDLNDKIKSLNQYKETYMVVEIPYIDESTIYAKYFSSCKAVWSEKSGYIPAFVYDCSKAPDVTN